MGALPAKSNLARPMSCAPGRLREKQGLGKPESETAGATALQARPFAGATTGLSKLCRNPVQYKSEIDRELVIALLRLAEHSHDEYCDNVDSSRLHGRAGARPARFGRRAGRFTFRGQSLADCPIHCAHSAPRQTRLQCRPNGDVAPASTPPAASIGRAAATRPAPNTRPATC